MRPHLQPQVKTPGNRSKWLRKTWWLSLPSHYQIYEPGKLKQAQHLRSLEFLYPPIPQETFPRLLSVRKMRVPHSLHRSFGNKLLLSLIWIAAGHLYLSCLPYLSCSHDRYSHWITLTIPWDAGRGSISTSVLASLRPIKIKWKQLSWLLDRQLPTPQFFWKKKSGAG